MDKMELCVCETIQFPFPLAHCHVMSYCMPLIQYPWIKADKRLNFASKICSVVQLKDYFCQQFVGNLIEDWNRWNLEDNESNTTISVGPFGRATSSWFDIRICIFLLLKKRKETRSIGL